MGGGGVVNTSSHAQCNRISEVKGGALLDHKAMSQVEEGGECV